MERAAFSEQLIGEPGRVGPGDREIVGNPGLAGRGLGAVQRASQPVAGSRVPWSAGRIAVPRQRSGSGSASQPSSSVSKTSGRSSCGKWPAPSITRQRYGPVDVAPGAPRGLREHAAVQGAVQVQGRGLDRGPHVPGVAQPVGPHAAAGEPAVVFQRGVRHRGYPHGPGVDPLGLRVGPAGRGPFLEHPAHPQGAVPQQLALGQDGQLEPERVAAAAALAERVGEHRGAHPQRVPHRDHGQPPDHLGVVGGQRPGDQPAQAVADHDRVRLAQRPDQPGRVGGGGDQVIAAGRLVAAAVAAQVHRDRAEARPGQHGQLMAPGPPELGEPVQQQHQRPVAGLRRRGTWCRSRRHGPVRSRGRRSAPRRRRRRPSRSPHRVLRAAISGRWPSGCWTVRRSIPSPSVTVLRVLLRPDSLRTRTRAIPSATPASRM